MCPGAGQDELSRRDFNFIFSHSSLTVVVANKFISRYLRSNISFWTNSHESHCPRQMICSWARER